MLIVRTKMIKVKVWTGENRDMNMGYKKFAGLIYRGELVFFCEGKEFRFFRICKQTTSFDNEQSFVLAVNLEILGFS